MTPAAFLAVALLLTGCAAPSQAATRVLALQRFYDAYPASHGVLKLSAVRAAAADSLEADVQQPEGLTFIKFTFGGKTEYGVWKVGASGRFLNPIINRPQYHLAAAFARNAKTHTPFPMGQSQQRRILQETVFKPDAVQWNGTATQVVLSGLQEVHTQTYSHAFAVDLHWFYDPRAATVVYVRGDNLDAGY